MKDTIVYRDLREALKFLLQLLRASGGSLLTPNDPSSSETININCTEKIWQHKCDLEAKLKGAGKLNDSKVYLPIACFIDELSVCNFGLFKNATGVTVTLVLMAPDKRTSLAFKVLLGACRKKEHLDDLVRRSLVQPLLKMQSLNDEDMENWLVVDGKVYHPVLHYICGDDPGFRGLVGIPGWIALLSRYFSDTCGKYSRTENRPPIVKRARERDLKTSERVKVLFEALALLVKSSTDYRSDIPSVKKAVVLLKRRFAEEGVRWPGFEAGVRPTALLALSECQTDLFSMLMPCILHLFHLGLCKRLWFWIGQLLGKEFRKIVNGLLREGKQMAGLETSLRSDLWDDNGECVSRPGRFWKEVTNYGVSILTCAARHAAISATSENFISNCFAICALLRHTTALQNILFSRTFTHRKLSDLEELVKAWKDSVMSIFKDVKDVNFNMPNFDNSTSLFLLFSSISQSPI